MCKLDLHLSFCEVVWDTLLVLWIVRLASKLYFSGWHVQQFRSPVSSLGRLGQRPAGLTIYSFYFIYLFTFNAKRFMFKHFCERSITYFFLFFSVRYKTGLYFSYYSIFFPFSERYSIFLSNPIKELNLIIQDQN